MKNYIVWNCHDSGLMITAENDIAAILIFVEALYGIKENEKEVCLEGTMARNVRYYSIDPDHQVGNTYIVDHEIYTDF